MFVLILNYRHCLLSTYGLVVNLNKSVIYEMGALTKSMSVTKLKPDSLKKKKKCDENPALP